MRTAPRPPSPGPAIVERIEENGVRLRADGADIVVTPLQLLLPEHRELVKGNRDAVLATLRARDIKAMDVHAYTECAKLDRGFRTHYAHAMPEPTRPCRCVHYKAALPW